jgi:hypothetical protein
MAHIQTMLVEDHYRLCSATLDHLLSISATRVSRSTDDSCSSMESNSDRIPSGSNNP